MNESPLRWVILAAGLAMAAFAFQYRQPQTTSDFTLFYRSAAAPASAMYAQPVGTPRGNMNPPQFQLLIEPLTNLPIETAATVWRALNTIALAICLWFLARRSEEKWGVADIGALLAWAPLQSAVSLNQLAWVLWPLLIATWWLWRSGRWTAGAIPFGIALSLKSFLGLFLVWLALRRQWRALAVAIASAAAGFAVGALAYGTDSVRAWIAAVASVRWSFALMNASLRGLLARTLTSDGAVVTPVADLPALVTPLFAVAAAAVMIVTLIRTRRADVDRSWPVLMAGALLVSPLGWIYYCWWMLPGFTPSRLMIRAPLLWIPMVCLTWWQPHPLATASIASAYTWGLLLVWWYGIGRIGPVDSRQVMQRNAGAPAVG
jgi:hypothetical protein